MNLENKAVRTASQAEAQQQLEQKQELPIQEVLRQSLSPLQQTIDNLQRQLEEVKSQQLARQEEEREKKLIEGSRVSAMLDDDDDKYERLSNKQLLEVIASAMDSALATNSERVKQEILKMSSADKKRLEDIEKVSMGILAHLSASEARSKYPDFDNHKQDISKVLEQYPNLSYDDAYLIAKSRRAGAVPPRTSIETERPDNFGTAPTSRGGEASVAGDDVYAIMASRGRQARNAAPEEPTRSGVVGFRALADAAIDKIISSQNS